jgi:hypothetical protein
MVGFVAQASRLRVQPGTLLSEPSEPTFQNALPTTPFPTEVLFGATATGSENGIPNSEFNSAPFPLSSFAPP